MRVGSILAFEDNIIWLVQSDLAPAVHERQPCVLIDPGEAAPVLARFESEPLALEAILLTHHHADHIGGVREILGRCSLEPGWLFQNQAQVWGPPSCAAVGAQLAADADVIQLPGVGMVFDVLAVPGHTADHIAYLGRDINPDATGPDRLFCGDTLFAAGCGRLLGGSAEQLWTSLNRLAELDKQTLVYPAHEYTLSNLAFAVHEFPDHAGLAARQTAVQQLRANGQLSLPTTIEEECETNPFLLAPDLPAFAAMRSRKDCFRAA